MTALLSHANDPDSSYAAAERHEGRAHTHAAIILDCVREAQGLTSREYADLTGLERHEVARRLSGLMHDGRVAQGESRKCNIAKTKAVTWRLAD